MKLPVLLTALLVTTTIPSAEFSLTLTNGEIKTLIDEPVVLHRLRINNRGRGPCTIMAYNSATTNLWRNLPGPNFTNVTQWQTNQVRNAEGELEENVVKVISIQEAPVPARKPLKPKFVVEDIPESNYMLPVKFNTPEFFSSGLTIHNVSSNWVGIYYVFDLGLPSAHVPPLPFHR